MASWLKVLLLAATTSVVVASPAAAPAPALVCNADNCLRAIRATQIAGRAAEGSADCSKYLATVTVTPGATYTTTTVTAFSATITNVKTTTTTTKAAAPANRKRDLRDTRDAEAGYNPQKRDVSPNDGPVIPSYASACTSGTRYSSACACIGVFPATVTAATPTSVITRTMTTVSVTSTTTTTVAVVAPTNVVQNSGFETNGGHLTGIAPPWVLGGRTTYPGSHIFQSSYFARTGNYFVLTYFKSQYYNTGANGYFSQVVSLIPGSRYDMTSYYYVEYGATAATPFIIDALIDGVKFATTSSTGTPAVNSPHDSYVKFTGSFIAPASSSNFTISISCPQCQMDWHSIFFDDITIQ